MPRGGDKIPSILEMMWNKPRDFMVKKSGEKTSIEQGDMEIPFVPELSYMWRGGKTLDFEFIGSFSLLALSLFLIDFSVNLRLECLNREDLSGTLSCRFICIACSVVGVCIEIRTNACECVAVSELDWEKPDSPVMCASHWVRLGEAQFSSGGVTYSPRLVTVERLGLRGVRGSRDV
ncbi:hypothetical protein DY000_02007362 [Brassica cretica]|uniref:Uncharacterized protein n=1 Tax=Brassica cretica TaxID=69181 RepID=A0ABQ7BZE4_BRACR|nr:hypothetical protein DY000_02007362 [Brassica cretica]